MHGLMAEGPPELLPPNHPERPAKRVQPFPVVELTTSEELVVPPREFGTLVESPEPRHLPDA